MKLLLCALSLCLYAVAQTTPAATQSAAPSAVSLENISLPTYAMFGVAYNQLAGYNFFASGITPEVNSISLFASASLDLTPVKYTTASGTSAYVLSGSFRFGQHKQLYFDGKNWLSIGADLGPSFSSSPAGNAGLNIGIATSFTLTYARKLSTHWGIAAPVRMLYMSGVGPGGSGVWNPVAEIGLTFIK